MVQELSISERRACRYAGLSRTSYREPPSMNESTASLSTRIVELAHERRRFGYRRIHDVGFRRSLTLGGQFSVAINSVRLRRLSPPETELVSNAPLCSSHSVNASGRFHPHFSARRDALIRDDLICLHGAYTPPESKKPNLGRLG